MQHSPEISACSLRPATSIFLFLAHEHYMKAPKWSGGHQIEVAKFAWIIHNIQHDFVKNNLWGSFLFSILLLSIYYHLTHYLTIFQKYIWDFSGQERGLKCSYIQILVVREILICIFNFTSCGVLKIQTQTLVACMAGAALSVGEVTVTP